MCKMKITKQLIEKYSPPNKPSIPPDVFNEGNFMVSIFLDFKKAFDTVDHQILFDKLYKLGIRGTPLKWLTSYLTERKQYVCIDRISSSHIGNSR